MGGASSYLQAKTKTELRKKAAEFERNAKAQGLYVDAGYCPERVDKLEDGYGILVHAHT